MSDCIGKFATYHLYNKEIFIDNSTCAFICTINIQYFLCNYENLSLISLFTNNGSTYIVGPGLVTKKKELIRVVLYDSSNILQLLSLIFSLMVFKSSNNIQMHNYARIASQLKFC